jgi:hypothetical protein
MARECFICGRSAELCDCAAFFTNRPTPVPTTTEALKWPLWIAGLILLPPIVLCVVLFPVLDEGHPPGSIIPMAYLLFAAAVGAPFGIWASSSAAKKYAIYRARAVLLVAFFATSLVVSWGVIWILFAP